jgi:hypothetical protein
MGVALGISQLKGRTQRGCLRTGRMFGRKREEIAGGWRKLRNEELRTLYYSPNIMTTTAKRKRLA